MSEEYETEIRIGDFEDFKKAALGGLRRKEPAEGPNKRIIYLTPKNFATVFSACRLELLHLLRHHPGLTVQELAEKTSRHQEAISRDLGVLRRFGLLPAGKGTKLSIPSVLQIRT